MQLAVLPLEEGTHNCFLPWYREGSSSLPISLKSFFTRNCLVQDESLSQESPVSKTEITGYFSPPMQALGTRQPQTRWPLLTPWRAALKGCIHLWGLKAPLSLAGGGGGSGGLYSIGRNASGEVALRVPVSRSPPELHQDPFMTPSPPPR